MNYQNSSFAAAMRLAAKIGTRNQYRQREIPDLAGWMSLWKPVGKRLLVVFPLVLGLYFLIASSVARTEQRIVALDNHRHALTDKHIELLARRASLYAPANMARMAEEKLALHQAARDQVGRFDRRTGTFVYP